MRKPTGYCDGCAKFIRIRDGYCRACRATIAVTETRSAKTENTGLVRKDEGANSSQKHYFSSSGESNE